MDTQYNQHQHPHQQLNDKDYENQGNADFNEGLRLGFIRKVFGILSFQLLITVVMCSLTFIDNFRSFFIENLTIFWVCLGLSIMIIIPLICCKSVARKTPTNYVLLTLWTICEAYMVATCCSKYEPKVVIAAASMTCAVTLALTVYSFTTKSDFTFLGGMLFVSVVALMMFGIFAFIVPALHALYCILGVLLYSIYLIYDIQLVMGKFGLEYKIDDYILAALMIYIDIIQIFLYLLELFGKK